MRRLAILLLLVACHHGDPCSGDARVAEVWNDGTRAAVRAGFAGAAWAPQTIAQLDAVANEWKASYHAVCESGEHRDVRMPCLDRALAQFSTLTAQLGHLDGPGRIAAPAWVAQLPEAHGCETISAAGDAPPASHRLWQVAASERSLAEQQIASGRSGDAIVTLTRARDRMLTVVGDKHPELALYDDSLAAALRARGKLRDAIQRSNQGLALREAAFGRDDRTIATSLLGRAQTEIEGGDLNKAFEDLQKALAIRTKADGAASPTLDEIYAAIADARAAARNPPPWVLDLPPHAPTPERFAGATQVTSDDDPAVAAAVGEKLLAAGDKEGATRVLKAAADRLGEEPTRTALRIYIALARASGDAQAARAAIAAYQAMPEGDRGAYDEMWAISRR